MEAVVPPWAAAPRSSAASGSMARERPAATDEEDLDTCVLRGLLGVNLRQMAQEMREPICEVLRDAALKEIREPMRAVLRDELERALAHLGVAPEGGRQRAEDKDSRPPTILEQTLSSHSHSEASVVIEAQLEGLEELADHMGEKKSLTSIAEVLAQVSPFLERPARCFESVTQLFGVSSAPPRSDCLSRFVDGSVFLAMTYTVICLNVVFMVYAADQEVERYSQGLQQGKGYVFIQQVELIFLALYTAEFVLKIIRFGRFFWIDANWRWNWMDTGLLALSYYFAFLDSLLPNLQWLRMVRLLKLAKALRIFRLVHMFNPLRAILKSLVSTVDTLCWSMVMLFVILFMFALVFALLTGFYLQSEDASLDASEKDQLVTAFGTVSQGMVGLFMCVTGGTDWEVYYRAAELTGVLGAALFLYFVAFTNIALLNIILGLFVEQAMKSMAPEKEMAARLHAEEQRQLEKDLTDVLKNADTKGDGKITCDEWRAAVRSGDIISYLDLIGFKSANVLQHFKMMAKQSPDGAVSIEKFVDGCMHMKGVCSTYDNHVILHQLRELSVILMREQAAITQLLLSRKQTSSRPWSRSGGNPLG